MASPPTQARVHRAIASLQRLTDVFRERRQQLAREVDLSESQWRLLEEVAAEAFMPSMFARRRDCTPAAVSRTLKQLLDRELITVSIAEGDARQRVYRLTTSGRRILRRVQASREKAIAETWAGFSARDLDSFSAVADELSEGLEAYALEIRRKTTGSG